MKKDAALAHYNIDPEAEIHGLDNAVGAMEHVADKEAAKSELVEAVQLKTQNTFAEGDEDEDSTAEQES
jgi:hypothetical protein